MTFSNLAVANLQGDMLTPNQPGIVFCPLPKHCESNLKLVKQEKLYFQEGKSDKVYEVDLCELGNDAYVVNFRYGRRGSSLKEGTKTGDPVTLPEAEAIFEKLVASKTKKGYVSTFVDNAPEEPQVEIEEEQAESDLIPAAQKAAIVNRIKIGHAEEASWKLSRAVWRAGELYIEEAAEYLRPLLGSADEMLDYCILWSLGRLRKEEYQDIFKSYLQNTDSPPKIRRIAMEGLRSINSAWSEARTGIFQQLPTELKHAIETDGADLLEALIQAFEANKDPSFIETIYLFVDQDRVKQQYLAFLSQLDTLRPPVFRRIRHVLKAAEFRDDSETYGVIYHLIETKSTGNAYSYWISFQENCRRGYGFTPTTRDYLKRRSWRQLQKTAKIGDTRYCEFAADILCPFTDRDKTTRTIFSYDYQTYRYNTSEAYGWENYLAFNKIMYGNHAGLGQGISKVTMYQEAEENSDKRFELYRHLWDKNPAPLVKILKNNACNEVHIFACKILSDLAAFTKTIEIPDIISFLSASYECTTALGFDLAKSRYDRLNPDLALIAALACCDLERGRQQAHQWIEEQKAAVFADHDILICLMFCVHSDTKQFMQRIIGQQLLSAAEKEAIIVKSVSELLTLEESQSDIAEGVIDLLLKVFDNELTDMSVSVIQDLLNAPITALNRFAGELVLRNKALSSNPPVEIIDALLSSSDSSVRIVGVKIISQLPDNVLMDSTDALLSMCMHALADIRDAIRPTIKRLIEHNAEFTKQFSGALITALLTPGAAEGAPTHVSNMLSEDFLGKLNHVENETIFKLLKSRSKPAQDIGASLLMSNVNGPDVSVEQITRLSHHKLLAVREWSWQQSSEQLERLKENMDDAVLLFASKWNDTLEFAKELFSNQFTADDFEPKHLVGICDSTDVTVQQYGRELITKHFKDGDGVEYMLKLSEHPSTVLQTHTTNYLENYAKNNFEHLAKLKLYFVTVLSQVNKSRVAKDRILKFLVAEALTGEEQARFVADILTRQSVTSAITDKEPILHGLLAVKNRYPAIDIPLIQVPVEQRHGV